MLVGLSYLNLSLPSHQLGRISADNPPKIPIFASCHTGHKGSFGLCHSVRSSDADGYPKWISKSLLQDFLIHIYPWIMMDIHYYPWITTESMVIHEYGHNHGYGTMIVNKSHSCAV